MSNEVANYQSAVAADIASVGSGASDYVSIQGDDFDTRLTVLDAVSNSEPLSENLNKKIDLKEIIIQRVQLADEVTGEISDAPRTVLIDAAGKAYHAISTVLFRDVSRLIGVLGEPSTWPAPIAVKVKQVTQGKNRMFKLELVK